jgi:hypothetical protein
VLVAASHTFLGFAEGWFDGGDYSLLIVAAPFVVLTVLAAALVSLRRHWARVTALVLTSLGVWGALWLVPLYTLGLWHLPQAIAALVITVRAKP